MSPAFLFLPPSLSSSGVKLVFKFSQRVLVRHISYIIRFFLPCYSFSFYAITLACLLPSFSSFSLLPHRALLGFYRVYNVISPSFFVFGHYFLSPFLINAVGLGDDRAWMGRA